MSDEIHNSQHNPAAESSRPPFETCLKRGLRLRCPRCGQGKLFTGPVRMHERCSHCHLKYERDHGYFLGAIYINYGLTSLSSAFLFVMFTLFLGYNRTHVILALLGYCCVVPVLIHRFARSMWLAIDCHFDSDEFGREDD